MTLKSTWERHTQSMTVTLQEIAHCLGCAPEHIQHHQQIKNGCANTNIRITLNNGTEKLLRLYTRDPEALAKELALADRYQDILPIPSLIATGHLKSQETPFAVMTYINDKNMRDVILHEDESAIYDCSFSAGQLLQKLARITLPKAGFFDADLTIKSFSTDENLASYFTHMLETSALGKTLGKSGLRQLQTLATDHILPQLRIARTPNLTHADFDPSNMLAARDATGHYRVTALLDWEFAFSYHWLFDAGLYLRYQHDLPPSYTQGFIEGFEAAGGVLPDNWMTQAKALDCVNIVQLLQRAASTEKYQMRDDLLRLLTQTHQYFGT